MKQNANWIVSSAHRLQDTSMVAASVIFETASIVVYYYVFNTMDTNALKSHIFSSFSHFFPFASLFRCCCCCSPFCLTSVLTQTRVFIFIYKGRNKYMGEQRFSWQSEWGQLNAKINFIKDEKKYIHNEFQHLWIQLVKDENIFAYS